MAINLANNNPRVVYTVAEGVTQTVFAVPFEFFEDADINIYVDGVLKAEGTDYTLTGGEGATGTLTFVTAEPGETQQVTGAVGGSTVVLVRRIAIERTTDFQQGLDINRAALNEQLDVLTALVADMNDRWDRAIHLFDSDTGQVNFTLPASSVRAGNYFAFDQNGDPVMTSGTTSTLVVSAFAETFLNDNTGAEVLNTLGVTASPAELSALEGVTWTLTDYNTLTASATELNLLDGVTSKTGADNLLVTGTAGTDGQIAQWNADGDVVGVDKTLPEADWETGTSTTESLVSPVKVAAAVDALVDTTKVLTETSGASVGAVGTFAFLVNTGSTASNPGNTTSASNLRYFGVRDTQTNNAGNIVGSVVSAGTWRCMGQALNGSTNSGGTLWLRIA